MSSTLEKMREERKKALLTPWPWYKKVAVGAGVGLIILVIGIWIASMLIPVNVEKVDGMLRSSVESSPANEKDILLPYLDKTREVSDAGMQFFKEGKMNELYGLMDSRYKQQAKLETFQQSMESLYRAYGKALTFEYRNQAFEYPTGKVPLQVIDQSQSKTWYAVRAQGTNSKGLFLIIVATRFNGVYGIKTITYSDYGEKIPSWLLYANAPAAPQP